MHEEARGLDIQLFADVFANLDEILAALAAGARLGLMAVFNARQMLGQWLAAGAFALGLLGSRTRLFNFGFQRTGVGIPAFLEQLALFRGERLALVGEANALVVSELEGQSLNFSASALALSTSLPIHSAKAGSGLNRASSTAKSIPVFYHSSTLQASNSNGFRLF